MSILKYRAAGSVMAALFVGLLLLAACGDNTATPPSAASPTAASATTAAANAAATTAAGGTTASSTTAAAGTTATTAGAGAATTAAAASGGTPSSNCVDPGGAATVAANQPQATSTSSAAATLPNLVYTGQRDIKATDATNKAIIDNLSGPSNEAAFGKFTADKVSFAFSSDSYDKVDAAYRKLLEGEGWKNFRAETDAPTKQSLLVYQKDASKIVLSIIGVDDISQYPPEFKNGFKAGDTLILLASGKAASGTAAPTPFAIPGSAILEIKPGQHKYATIELEKGGKIVMELCPNLAPKTVENFEKLATKGFYNGLTFHRVEKDPKPFVVQGGDPKGDGTGGPGYQIPDEFTSDKKHTRGTVAMAHSAAPNSGGSQFYICLDEASFLDGKYAIFGQVIQGMDLVDKIAVGDKMKSVTIEVK